MVQSRLELAEDYLGIEVVNRVAMSSSEVLNTLKTILPGGPTYALKLLDFALACRCSIEWKEQLV